LQAAVKFRDELVSSLPKKIQDTLNNGKPRHKKDAGISLCKRKKYKSRYYDYYYVAYCWNKYTKSMLKKSISITPNRLQPEALKLAKEYRKKFVAEVAVDAKQYGFMK